MTDIERAVASITFDVPLDLVTPSMVEAMHEADDLSMFAEIINEYSHPTHIKRE
jgi:hypothetical protein